jgi:hypothetical protein
MEVVGSDYGPCALWSVWWDELIVTPGADSGALGFEDGLLPTPLPGFRVPDCEFEVRMPASS